MQRLLLCQSHLDFFELEIMRFLGDAKNGYIKPKAGVISRLIYRGPGQHLTKEVVTFLSKEEFTKNTPRFMLQPATHGNAWEVSIILLEPQTNNCEETTP
jgi:hypothetical protein